MSRSEARYRDGAGELVGSMLVEDNRFVLEVGGVRFEDMSPDSLEPVAHTPWADVERFRLSHGALWGCELEWSQPLQIIVEERVEAGELLARLRLGWPEAGASSGRDNLGLGLERGERLVEGSGRDYEEALNRLRDGLPDGERLRCCYGCGLSDYSPYGQGLIGSLMCFAAHAQAYEAIDEAEHVKDALFELIERAAPLVWVAETHVCERFVPRRRGQGYRG